MTRMKPSLSLVALIPTLAALPQAPEPPRCVVTKRIEYTLGDLEKDLLSAVRNRETEKVRLLLARGANPDSCERGPSSRALYLACDLGQLEICRMLLQHGADPNQGGAWEERPLPLAASHADIDMCKLLVSFGADPLARGKNGSTALYSAISASRLDKKRVKVIHWLIAQGSNVNSRRDGGWTPLLDAAFGGSTPLCKFFLSLGADPQAKTNELLTALHCAAYHGNADTCRFFLKLGADINARDKFLATPLHKAADTKSRETLEVLLASGADVNAPSLNGATPLHHAAANGTRETCQVLLDNGAALETEDAKGRTPFEWAVSRKNQDVILFLQEVRELRRHQRDVKDGRGGTSDGHL